MSSEIGMLLLGKYEQSSGISELAVAVPDLYQLSPSSTEYHIPVEVHATKTGLITVVAPLVYVESKHYKS